MYPTKTKQDIQLIWHVDVAGRCVIFLRSGRTIKVDQSAAQVYDAVTKTEDLIVEIDGAYVNVDAIDSIEPVERINHKEN